MNRKSDGAPREKAPDGRVTSPVEAHSSRPTLPPAGAVSTPAAALLQALMTHTSALVTLKDRDDRFLMVNDAFCRAAGRSREDLLGYSIYDIAPALLADEWAAHDREVRLAREPRHYQETLRHADGRFVDYAVTKFPLLDALGETYAIGALRMPVDDGAATEAKQEAAEERQRNLIAELRATEQRQRRLLHGLPDAVLVLDVSGSIRDVTSRAVQLLGYARDELVGRSIEDLVPPRGSARLAPQVALIAREASQSVSTGRDLVAVRRDGQEVPVEITLSAVVLEDGPAVIAAVRDVTELRELQRHLQLGEQRQRALLQGIPDAVIVIDAKGTIREINTQTTELFGYGADELVGQPVELLVPHRLGKRHVALRGAYTAAAQAQPMSTGTGVSGLRKDGAEVPIEISLSSVMLDDGPAVVATVRDVTQTRALQRELHASEAQFRQAFADAPTGMLLTSLAGEQFGRILRVNRTLCTLLERRAEDLVGEPAVGVIHPEDLHGSAAAARAMAAGSINSLQAERRMLRQDGSTLWARLSTSVVRGLDGEPAYAVTQVEDITDRRLAEQRLEHQALHDALTGLPNRALLLDHLRLALSRAHRHRNALAVLYLDLDNFKDVNDALGHAAGDELLVDFAGRLTACLRATDTAGRLGGDEFVVICEDLDGPDEAAIVAARVEAALDVDVPVRDYSIRVTASIGVAMSVGGDRAEDLLREADTAMYQAKRAGRGRFAVADPEAQTRALRQVTLGAELRRALADDSQLELAYQPVFDSPSGQVMAVEALLRWRHPDRGLLLPGAFLDVAEDRELMVPLGAHVLRLACAQGAAWHREYGDRAPQVWVNISSRQLGHAGLTALAAEVLAETGLPPSLLCLELTERQVVEIDEAVQRDLDGLVGLGCRLALDDFGTGHNDMTHLRDLPLYSLKIDKSYVDALGRERAATAIASSVVTLGRALGLVVVGEGIETADQAERLQELGCDLLQGYHLARPGPTEAVDRLLAQGR